MPSFQASGTSFGSERALDQLSLEVEAEDDVEAVRRLVGLDPDEPGLGAVDRRRGSRRGRRPRAAAGNVSWSGSYQCDQNGRLRPTRFSHVRLCDSLRPSEGECASERSLERGRDAVGVEAVARPRASSTRASRARRVVARRQPDVAGRERRAERVNGRVEPPCPVLEPECRDHTLGECHAGDLPGT